MKGRASMHSSDPARRDLRSAAEPGAPLERAPHAAAP